MIARAVFSLRTAAALVVGFGCTVAAALETQQFVAGWPLAIAGEPQVFDVPLTPEVYAVTADVEQLAVLDAQGVPLPFFKRTETVDATERRVTLEASPLYADGRGSAMTIGVTAGGAAVTVNQPGTVAPEIVGFVLDARAASAAPSVLELDWRALPQPFLLDVRVEQSNDLANWRLVGAAPVAALTIGADEVRHTRVPVSAAAGGYLRVTASRSVADWYLLRATLVSSERESAPRNVARVAPLAARPADSLADAVYFDAGAPLPVRSFALDFGADGGWTHAEVAVAESLAGPWMPVARELFYAVDFGSQRFSSPSRSASRTARYWRVEPAQPLRGTRFDLVLEYAQEYLRVAGRGSAPYLLAAGTLAPDAGPDAAFASVWRQVPAPAAVPLAELGERRALGGAAALVAPRETPWRLVLLWAALGAGVLVVGVMAVKLARELSTRSA